MIKDRFYSFFRRLKDNKWNFLLIFTLILIFVFVDKKTSNFQDRSYVDNKVRIFTQDGCVHCREIENFFNESYIKKYNIVFLNLKDGSNVNLLVKFANKHNIDLNKIGTPIIFTKEDYHIGFKESDIDKIISIMDKNLLKEDNKVSEVENKFLYILKSVYYSIFNLYSLIFIIIYSSLILLNNNVKKTNIMITSFLFSYFLLTFLLLSGWLNVYFVSSFTRIINLLFSLFLLYFVVNNFYYLFKYNKNIFDNGEIINRNIPILVTIISLILSSINITRNTGILNITSNLYFTIYSFFSSLIFFIILFFINKIFNRLDNKNLFLNILVFLFLIYCVFLMKY